ncbi:hypothetical protein JFL43_10515 [Viridibacillus sp. YIM B01967]|uniref:Uncharacterized protein n=1 Tax=Viridibacillus soli TaxID=2798301 RepID=A0ABS1H777_9BACL|nr:hypothetical protein [Viridibacillus soli]MBK3495277.1 hypothetical protein [Viridibacillus soli]
MEVVILFIFLVLILGMIPLLLIDLSMKLQEANLDRTIEILEEEMKTGELKIFKKTEFKFNFTQMKQKSIDKWQSFKVKSIHYKDKYLTWQQNLIDSYRK